MNIGAIVIGDEILRGKRQDRHLARVIQALGERGLDLSWCRYLGDDARLITGALRDTYRTGDLVFSFGGIGATPDDLTRQCAADAAGIPLVRHPEALALIVDEFGDGAYPKRVLMADLPEGCDLVPNPYNRIPGFSVGEHHFLPGFPEMAWPMMEWVLDTRYPHLRRTRPPVEGAVVVRDAMESQLIDLMNEVVAAFPGAKLFSLPSYTPEGRRIELGIRGEPQVVAEALARIREGVQALGFPFDDAA